MSNVSIAPAHPLGQGKSSPGGHYRAYKAQGLFDVSATLKILTTDNPWRDGSPGREFFDKVLAKNPATVGAAIELGSRLMGLKPRAVQNHLRWLYTWAGAFVEIGGKRHSAEPVVSAPVAAPKASTKKSTAKASA